MIFSINYEELESFLRSIWGQVTIILKLSRKTSLKSLLGPAMAIMNLQ